MNWEDIVKATCASEFDKSHQKYELNDPAFDNKEELESDKDEGNSKDL